MPRDTLFGIEEAPSDGTPYGRVDADWKSVPSEAPLDDKAYARKNATWEEAATFAEPPDDKLHARRGGTNPMWERTVDEAPLDAQGYVRKEGGWEPGIADPVDEKLYARGGGTNPRWERTVDEAPLDSERYARTDGGWVAVQVPLVELAIEFIVPNRAPLGSKPVTVEAHGSKFTATTVAMLDGVAVATNYVSPTELTFQIDPTLENTVRTASITVTDGMAASADSAPFYFTAPVMLYQGIWEVAANTPPLNTIPRFPGWMWIASTVVPTTPETPPPGIAGLDGLAIYEGDHVVCQDGNAFILVRGVIPPNYRGLWNVATNDPPIDAPPLGNNKPGWMWIAKTVDPAVPETAGAAIPGIGGKSIHEGDHIVWDKANDVFVLVSGNSGAGTDFGKGLSVDRTQTPQIVNLTPAGNEEKFLGGVYVPLRADNQGLVVETTTGALVAPLATPLLAGTIVEPVDDKLYARGGGTNPRWERTVDEAPLDAQGYMRSEGGWVPAPTDPVDDKLYARGGGTNPRWERTVDEAPLDVKQYARSDGGWVEVVGGVTISDTPPQNATPGQLWWESDTGATFIWYDDGAGAQWVQTDGGSSGGAVYTSDAPPAAPAPNSLWWDSDSGKMYVNYTDVDSTQWVECIGSSPGPATVTVADFAPTSPVVNQLWWSSLDSNMYLWFDDGTSAQWVQVSGDSVAQLPLSGGNMDIGSVIKWSPGPWTAAPNINYESHILLNKDAGYRMAITATTNGRFNYLVENNNNYHSFFVGGIEQFQIGLNGINVFGNPFVGGGISFGSSTVSAHDDFSKHICLYGSPGAGFGFTVSPSTMNYCVQANTNVHNFWGGDEFLAQINQSGVVPKSGGFVMPSESEEIGAFAPDAIATVDEQRTYRVDKVLEVAVAKIMQLQAEVASLQAKMKTITDLT